MFYFLFSVFFLSSFFFANNLPSTRASKKLANHAANIESVSYSFFVISRLHNNLLIIIYSTTCVFALFRRHFFFFRWVTVYMLQNTVLPFPTLDLRGGVKSALRSCLPKNFLQKSFKSFTHTH